MPASLSPEEQFWILQNGEPAGPFSKKQLGDLLAQGKVTWGTKVCPVGGADWKPLHHNLEFTANKASTSTQTKPVSPAGRLGVNGNRVAAKHREATPKRISKPSRRFRYVLLALGILTAIGIGYATLRSHLRESFGGYERGYGDTIVRYADRSYEGAKWTRLKEGDAFADLATIADRQRFKLRCVSGWDAENVWISAEASAMDSVIIRLKDGHWAVAGKVTDATDSQILRATSADTACFAGSYSFEGALWRLDSRGIRQLAKTDPDCSAEMRAIVPISPDLSYFVGQNCSVYRVEGDTVKVMKLDLDKQMFLHSRNNLPLKEFPVTRLTYPRTICSGTSYAAFRGLDRGWKLGVWEDGTWFEVRELPQTNPWDMWLCRDGNGVCVTLVGSKGWVHQSRANGLGVDRILAAPTELTPSTLIKVWGTSPEKFWTMDDTGTVWEFNGSESRVVVRGMRRDDVSFRDAWVSPTGTVFAITDKHLYQLE
jgi:hypothetical protein